MPDIGGGVSIFGQDDGVVGESDITFLRQRNGALYGLGALASTTTNPRLGLWLHNGWHVLECGVSGPAERMLNNRCCDQDFSV